MRKGTHKEDPTTSGRTERYRRWMEVTVRGAAACAFIGILAYTANLTSGAAKIHYPIYGDVNYDGITDKRVHNPVIETGFLGLPYFATEQDTLYGQRNNGNIVYFP